MLLNTKYEFMFPSIIYQTKMSNTKTMPQRYMFRQLTYLKCCLPINILIEQTLIIFRLFIFDKF